AATGLGQGSLVRLLELLEEDGIVRHEHGVYELGVDDFDPSAVSLEHEEARRAYERSRVDMMRGYAELRECRRRYIMNYFGEESEWTRWGRGDIDVTPPSAGGSAPGPFEVNDNVRHVTMGPGVVERVTADTVSVLFERFGYMTLSLELVDQ